LLTPFQQIQPVLSYAAHHCDGGDGDVSLAALAGEAGLSPSHLQRVFVQAVGETPKQLTLRLRLERAAALLLARRDPVLDIALVCGFASHEVFTRAFQRRFGMAPLRYRQRGRRLSEHQARTHAEWVAQIGPCIGLIHRDFSQETRTATDMTYTIEKKNLEPQPVLVVQRRVKRSDIAATIGGTLGLVFSYAQKNGIALSGFPITRYLESGPGMVTMQPGMRIASAGAGAAAEDEDVKLDTLPGGAVVMTMHAGSYDQLMEAYAALEVWIAEQGLTPAGAPWEAYVNDPGDFPDPKDWKTEVFWPVK